MKRRTFLVRVGGALVAVPASLRLVACGGGGGGGNPDGGGSSSFTVMNDDNAGHTHHFSVVCTDLTSGSSHTYTATGSGHTHQVTITSGDLAKVANGETVMITTTTPHMHIWVVDAGNQC